MSPRLAQRLRHLARGTEGAAAVEFALLVLPFTLLILVILELSLMYFVDTSLDGALTKSARKVRVGTAAQNNWTITQFKSDLCANLTLAFRCSSQLLVRATVITDMSSVSYASSTSNGTLTVTETFNIGGTGDYVLIQAFLPWSPVVPIYSFSSARLADGTYVLAAAKLFKNEPY